MNPYLVHSATRMSSAELGIDAGGLAGVEEGRQSRGPPAVQLANGQAGRTAGMPDDTRLDDPGEDVGDAAGDMVEADASCDLSSLSIPFCNEMTTVSGPTSDGREWQRPAPCRTT